jgi:citrate lyase subunit beta/citryl-CoA lyase
MVYFPSHIHGFRFRRSVLFMPATNERALTKAKSLAADCLIFDLEDAIAGGDRSLAHANLLKYVKDNDFDGREIIVRTSVVGTSGFKSDLEIALQCQPDAVLLPKTCDAIALQQVARMLTDAGSAHDEIRLWAMIETPLALMNLKDIATSTDRLSCLVVGPNDLARASGIILQPGRTALQPWLMQIVAAARAYDLNVLDGVYNKFRDEEGFTQECAQSAAMGFDGKTLIHPSQIEAANRAYGPNESEIDRAKTIIDTFEKPENQTRGVIQIDGEMIERLHYDLARQLLKLSGKEY